MHLQYRIMGMQNGMFESTRSLEVPTNVPIVVLGDDDGLVVVVDFSSSLELVVILTKCSIVTSWHIFEG